MEGVPHVGAQLGGGFAGCLPWGAGKTGECTVVARKVLAVSDVKWTQANVVLRLANVDSAVVRVNGIEVSSKSRVL